MSTVSRLLERLANVKPAGKGWSARCPAHEDQCNSLSIDEGDDGRVLLNCFAGCRPEAVVASAGMTMADLFPERTTRRSRKTMIVATYDYRDRSGKLAFQVVRYAPKMFRQRRPDGRGGWIYNLNGTKRVPYRLPELLTADAEKTVFVVEGEKDVDRLVREGLVATTNAGGAGKWRKEYGEVLRGRDVVVIPDNDIPGRRHAEEVARSLFGVARSVRVISL